MPRAVKLWQACSESGSTQTGSDAEVCLSTVNDTEGRLIPNYLIIQLKKAFQWALPFHFLLQQNKSSTRNVFFLLHFPHTLCYLSSDV